MWKDMRGKIRNKVYSPVGVVQSPRTDCAQRPEESEPSHDGERDTDDLSVQGKEEQRLEQQQTKNIY